MEHGGGRKRKKAKKAPDLAAKYAADGIGGTMKFYFSYTVRGTRISACRNAARPQHYEKYM